MLPKLHIVQATKICIGKCDMLFANVLGEDVDSFTDRRLAEIAEKRVGYGPV
jgi:hypothetical protein